MGKKKVDFEVLCCDRCGMTILEKGLIQTPEGVFCSKCLEEKQVLERKGNDGMMKTLSELLDSVLGPDRHDGDPLYKQSQERERQNRGQFLKSLLGYLPKRYKEGE